MCYPKDILRKRQLVSSRPLYGAIVASSLPALLGYVTIVHGQDLSWGTIMLGGAFLLFFAGIVVRRCMYRVLERELSPQIEIVFSLDPCLGHLLRRTALFLCGKNARVSKSLAKKSMKGESMLFALCRLAIGAGGFLLVLLLWPRSSWWSTCSAWPRMLCALGAYILSTEIFEHWYRRRFDHLT
jgi:hypothetical protein